MIRNILIVTFNMNVIWIFINMCIFGFHYYNLNTKFTFYILIIQYLIKDNYSIIFPKNIHIHIHITIIMIY